MNSATTSAIAPLALVLLGLGLGVLLAVVTLAICYVGYLVRDLRRETASIATISSRDQRNTATAISSLRSEVSLTLARLDADRLHEASAQVQAAAKTLARIANHLNKTLYTQAGMEGTVDQWGVPNDGLLGGMIGGTAPIGSALDAEAQQDAATMDQWNARQARQREMYQTQDQDQAQDQYRNSTIYGDSAPPTPRAPFLAWHDQQAARAAAAAGADSPIPPPTMPELTEAHDLDDNLPLGGDPLAAAGFRFPGVTDRE